MLIADRLSAKPELKATIIQLSLIDGRRRTGHASKADLADRSVYFVSKKKHVSVLAIFVVTGPVVHPRKFKRLCMGGQSTPYSVSNILDNWLRTVTRVSLSCTAIQAESNKLFFVIIKCVFAEIFRKSKRHCFYSFPRDFFL